MSRLALPAGEVHVWWCESASIPRSARAVLTPEERDRCDRFRFEEDRQSYLAAHAMLRVLLQRYGSPGAGAPFVVSEAGKPSVADGPRFSLSHTRGVVACAFAAGMEVGIDVEAVDRAVKVESLSERVLSRREIAALDAAPEAERGTRFIELWTSKEAWAKALGLGLRAEFRSLDTERLPPDLYLSTVEAPEGYRIAVASLGAPDGVDLRRFTME